MQVVWWYTCATGSLGVLELGLTLKGCRWARLQEFPKGSKTIPHLGGQLAQLYPCLHGHIPFTLHCTRWPCPSCRCGVLSGPGIVWGCLSQSSSEDSEEQWIEVMVAVCSGQHLRLVSLTSADIPWSWHILCILLPIFLSSTVRHSVKHPYPEEWGFFSLPPPQQSPQPAKSWQSCQNTRSDRYPSRCRSCMNNTSLHSLGVWMPPTPVFPLMACRSTAARRSSFILPGLWKEVHLQWLLEQENYLIPPVRLHLLQGITGEHKTSVHLCLSKPFLGYAARGRSSHMYKVPCRIWWKLRERTVMVFTWRFGSWSRTGGWGRTDAMGLKAKAASMSCLLLSQVMQISWHYRAADCCMCII